MTFPAVLLWFLGAAVSWWIGATGAAVRRDVLDLEEGEDGVDDYALIAQLRRFRDDSVVLGLRGRVARAFSAVFLPALLAGAVADWPAGWIAVIAFWGWLLGANAEASGGGSLVRRWGRARGGMGYALWARLLVPFVKPAQALMSLRERPPSEEASTARVFAESEASRSVRAFELGRQELRFLRRLLASRGILAADIATRWDAVCSIASDASFEAAQAAVRESGHSRLPVIGSGGVLGLVTVKDLLGWTGEGGRLPVRPIYFVREEITARDLLEELREARVHLAVTVDRLGRQTGIVTMEDVLEEIVGELHDEREAPAS